MGKFLDSIRGREVLVDENPEFEEIINSEPASNLKVCAICNRPFMKSRAKYCPRQHYLKCLVCGNRVDILPSHINGTVPKTCSKACADSLGVQTYKDKCIQKYGVSNPMLVPELVKDMISKRNPDFDFSLKEKEQFRNCEVCGKEFRYDYVHPRRCCSDECSVLLRKSSIESHIRVCKLCGKSFTSISGKAEYCSGPHYRTCEICGKSFLLKSNDSTARTCSEECKLEAYKRTCLDKYGVPISSQSEIVKEKLRLANEINRWRYIKFTEPKEPTPPTIKNCSICGEPFELEDNAQTICKRQHYRNCDVCGKLYEYNKPWTQLCCSKDCTQHKRTANKHIVGCDGTPLDSLYEKLVYDFWKSLGLEVKRNIPITFEYAGKVHTTFIDFEVEGILYEVKGTHLLQGLFDYNQTIKIDKKLEIYRNNHVIVITDSTKDVDKLFGKPNSKTSNGLKYLNKCPNPQIGVDIKLFYDNPDFPYAEDRPKCFYDVRVGGKRSAHEAFYDPQIRWNMIVNRIQYTGGFIDAKQVLTAMNVTRTCKQPSWFSVDFASDIIKKYCTSDTIVDSFAGWGARCDAAIRLNKHYVGIDLNEELVAWHKSLGRPIELGDATTFTYLDKCSVFICPPYQDIEVYFEGQNSELTQCQWLSLVMKNIPNASEYIMVCKVVDPGWEKYIAEVKENKSHFGLNKEYVIVVRL